MAGHDVVLFYGTAASGTSAGTVVPLSLLEGIENVRQGYGSAKLKGISAYFVGGGYNDGTAIPIEVKNSNWIDAAGLVAANMTSLTAYDPDGSNYMPGRDKELAPNTAWTIAAELPSNTSAALSIYVLMELEYSDVPGVDPAKLEGAPVLKKCANASVTASANTKVSLGSFDNLLQDVTYVISEATLATSSAAASVGFLILEGFSNQRGLTRIIPVRNVGVVSPIKGSVYIKKQTYNLSFIPTVALSSAPVTVRFEMIASKN